MATGKPAPKKKPVNTAKVVRTLKKLDSKIVKTSAKRDSAIKKTEAKQAKKAGVTSGTMQEAQWGKPSGGRTLAVKKGLNEIAKKGQKINEKSSKKMAKLTSARDKAYGSISSTSAVRKYNQGR
jgi:hypothetical protein